MLLDAKAVELLNAAQPETGPEETKPTGPLENKEAETKKSSAATQDGRSTDSAVSSELGMAEQSSASAEAQASQLRKSSKRVRRAAG